MPKDSGDTARDELHRRVADFAAALGDRLNPPGSDAEYIKALRSRDERMKDFAYLSSRIGRVYGEAQFAEEAYELAESLGAAAAKHPSAGTRRPPVQLVVLVLIWLILLAGPVVEGKLPSEIQTMLSTEIGTVALGLAITQVMSQKRK